MKNVYTILVRVYTPICGHTVTAQEILNSYDAENCESSVFGAARLYVSCIKMCKQVFGEDFIRAIRSKTQRKFEFILSDGKRVVVEIERISVR